jgi:protein-S-isoprenylcysteine O-methyltransferase Ste14
MWLTLLATGIFGVVHTLAAGWFKSRFRAWAGERAYHGLYRIAYNALALILFAPLGLLVVSANQSIIWQFPASIEPVFMLIQLGALIGLAASVLQIDGMAFMGISQALTYVRGEALPLPSEPLQTGGLYAIVRHPLYLFTLLLLWPVTVMPENYFGLCLGLTLYIVVGSYFEERRLRHSFGQAYVDYQARVPWLIPFVRIGLKG